MNKRKPLQRGDSLTVDDASTITFIPIQTQDNSPTVSSNEGLSPAVVNRTLGMSPEVVKEMDEHDDDHELLQFQKQRSMPMVQLSVVNTEEEAEKVLLEIDDFSKLDGTPHKQLGLQQAGQADMFAQAVLKTHASTESKE